MTLETAVKPYDPTVPSIHPTKVAAERLGLSPATIRTYKSRYAAHLEQHKHWVADPNNGSIWWTEQGIERLSTLGPNAKPYKANVDPNLLKRDALQHETDCVADFETPNPQGDDAVLDRLAMGIATEQVQCQLAPKVSEQRQRLLAAIAQWLQNPNQAPDSGIEEILRMFGLTIAAVRGAQAYAAFNVEAKQIVAQAQAMLREGQG